MGAKRNRELKAEPNNSYNSQWGNWMIQRYAFDDGEMRDALKGLHDRMLAETVEVDPEIMAVVDEHFMEMWQPIPVRLVERDKQIGRKLSRPSNGAANN